MNKILQYYGIIFSLTVIFLKPIQWTTYWSVCQQHWNIWAWHSFWTPLCFAVVAKCGQFVGTWLRSILYMAHYKGFACAEIWHSCVQSETFSFHLLLHPEMLKMPSLCVSTKIYVETQIWPQLCLAVRVAPPTTWSWEHQRASIQWFWVTTDCRISVHFQWSRWWLLRRGLRLVPVVTILTTIWIATFSCNQYWPHNSGCNFIAQTFVETDPPLFLFHFLWRNLMPVFIA